jgi:MFS family permease
MSEIPSAPSAVQAPEPERENTRTPRKRFAHPSSLLMLAVLWLVYSMNANATNIIFSTSTLTASDFALSPGQLGLIISLFMCARGLMAPVLSTWVDRGGQGWARKYRQLTIAAVYLGTCFLAGFTWVSGALAGFLAISLVRYFAVGVGEMIEVTAVSEWWPRNRRGFAQGAHHTGFPWGTFIGSQLVAVILAATDNDWRIAYMAFPIIALPFLALYWFTSTRRRYAKVVTFTRAQGEEMALGEDAGDTKAAPGAFGRALRNPNVHFGAVASGVQIAMYWGISTWIPLYLVNIGKYTAAAAAAASFLFTLTGGLGQVVWGAVSDKLGRKAVMIFCCVWLAAAVELLQFTTNSTFALVFFQLIFGVCSNAVFPILYAWGADSSEHGAVGISNSLQIFYQGLGALMPLLVGVLIAAGGGYHSSAGYGWSLHLMAGTEILCLLIVTLLMRETTGKRRGRDVALVSAAKCNIT